MLPALRKVSWRNRASGPMLDGKASADAVTLGVADGGHPVA
jgi:hypothetical protein